MGATITRRSLLSGAATAVGARATDVREVQGHAALQQVQGSPGPQVTHVSVPFGAGGLMGGSKEGEAYLEQLIRATIVPPLSQIAIYAHGWLTSASDLMVIYDTLSQGFETQLRTLSRLQAGVAVGVPTAPPLALPATSVVFTTHWPSRRSERGGPIDVADVVTFAGMEARANIVGETGMARLIGLLWELLLADPALAETSLLLISHSLGGRVLASALQALPARVPDTFAALQTRNRINLVMLQPAMPADALEPTGLTHAHPFGQLVNYQNLRILTTMSQWDTPLVRFYPAQEAQQPADAVYATAPAETRQGVPALGGAGPSDATWRAFNGALPRTDVAVGPGFQYADVLGKAGQRLVVADLSPLHAAHHREDLARPAGELPPFGRPDRRSLSFSGYHTDIYSKEMYQLVIGFAWGQQGL